MVQGQGAVLCVRSKSVNVTNVYSSERMAILKENKNALNFL